MNAPRRVAMLIFDDVTHDNRVRREAATLGALGYDVHVVSVPGSTLPADGDGVSHHALAAVIRGEHEDARVRRLRREVRDRGARYMQSKSARGGTWLLAGMRLAAARGKLRLAVARKRVRSDRHLAAVTSKLRYARAAQRVLGELRPDIVHAHDLKALPAGARYAKRARVPLVYDAHELETQSLAVVDRGDRAIARSFERRGIRHADAVVTVADAIADELARTYRIARPWVVLNTPSLRTLDMTPAFSLRDACGLATGDRLIAHVGVVHPARGTDRVVRALAELPESFHFVILGPRRLDRDGELERLAASLGVGGRLHLLDPVPGIQVPATLATADVSILPGVPANRSYELALANKLFESLMAGIPIAVSSARPSMAQFVREHELGVVFDVLDPASIAAAVLDAVEKLPAGLADAARLDALRRRYSWESQEETLGQLYAGL